MAPQHCASKAGAPVITPRREDVTAAVLAGGEGRRMGGDKPLRMLAGRPLIAHVLCALAPQAARLAVVARTEADAARLVACAAPFLPQGHVERVELMTDRPGLEGPVAALLGAAERTETPFLLTAPVDTPFLPPNLTARLAAALCECAGAAIAADARSHPTIALCRTAPLRACAPAKSLRATLGPLRPVDVPFPAQVLVNINTPEDLKAADESFAPPPACDR